MDKKNKQRRHKVPTRDELADMTLTPPGASFDTVEGRAAQGMPVDNAGDLDEGRTRPDRSEEKSPD